MGQWNDGIAARGGKIFCLSLAAAILFLSPVYAEDVQPAAAGASAPDAAPSPKHAGIASWNAPDAVKKMAHWVLDSGDNRGLPFAILDKPEAKVFVFDKSGKILGNAWVLVGLARGDDSVPGIGTMP